MDRLPTEEQWRSREEKFHAEVTDTLAAYALDLNKTWKRQRAIAIALMVCGVLAPMLVVGSAFDDAFGVPEQVTKGAAVVVTLTLAILEGLKRIFQFERRWAAIYWAKSAIKRARSDYRISQIGLDVGSEQWASHFKTYRDRVTETIDIETREFFDAFASSEPKNTAPEGSAIGLQSSKPQIGVDCH